MTYAELQEALEIAKRVIEQPLAARPEKLARAVLHLSERLEKAEAVLIPLTEKRVEHADDCHINLPHEAVCDCGASKFIERMKAWHSTREGNKP